MLAFVCVAAVAGGAGAVLLTPAAEAFEPTIGDSGGKRITVLCDRMVDPNAFNPRSARGHKLAKVAFRFRYATTFGHREAVRARIEQRWDMMVAAVYRLLKRRTAYELNTDEGLDALATDVKAAMSAELFPDGVAEVVELGWVQVLVQ